MFCPFLICHQFLLASTHSLISGFGLLIYCGWYSCPVVQSCTTVMRCPPPPGWSGGFVWVLCTEMGFTHSAELDCVLQGAATPGLHAASDPHRSREPAPPGRALQSPCHCHPQFGGNWLRKVQALLCFFIMPLWCSARLDMKTHSIFCSISFAGACWNSADALCSMCHPFKEKMV